MKKQGRILLITGSFGYIGKRLLERLKADTVFARVVCTDILPPPQGLPEKFVYRQCDIRDGARIMEIVKESGADTLIHLAFIANPVRDLGFEHEVDVRGTQNVLDACARLKMKKLVIASSDCAYGFFEGTPDYLPETAPVRSTPGFSYSENKAEIEALVAGFAKANPGCATVIMRPCIVMGPSAKNTTSKSLKDPVIIGVRGYDPIMQFVHEDDTAQAFYLAAVKDVRGAFNLAADEGIRYSALARELGKPALFLPAWLIYPLVETLYRLHVVPFGKAQVDYIRYPLSMDASKIRKVLGFKPRFTSLEAVRAMIEGK